MFEQSAWVWMDGTIVPWADATVHVSTHALHYGTGVFEGIRCYETPQGPAIFRLDAHLDRLFASAGVHGIEIPFGKAELTAGICELVRKNSFQSCYLRPICFYGSGALGLSPARCPVRVSILAWPWNSYLGDEALTRGARVSVSRWRKFHFSMMPTTAKACGQYLNSILALREATSKGYDEALLLELNGSISEGSGENLFIVRNKLVVTNDERHSILMGVTRDSIVTIARDLGFKVETRAFDVEDLRTADEAFFTGTAAEVTPVCAVDETQIGAGVRGPVTETIQRTFLAVVAGREPAYRHWLHLVHDAGRANTLHKEGEVPERVQ